MEGNGLYPDSEWPAAYLPLHWKKELIIKSEADDKTVFVTDEFGNVVLSDNETYRKYELHLDAQESRDTESLEAA